MYAATNRLQTFGEFKRKATADIYYPWEIYEKAEPRVFFEPESTLSPVSVSYDRPFEPDPDGFGAWRPSRLKLGRPTWRPSRDRHGGHVEARPWWRLGRPIRILRGTIMPRFHGGRYLRQQGKARMLGRLRILASGHTPGRSPLPFGFVLPPQKPLVFPELAGFGDVPIGSVNTAGSTEPQRGFWGDLTSLLSQVGGAVMTVQAQKTQREIAAAGAATAQAQAQAAQAGVSQTLYRNLPLIAAVGGGGVLLYIFMGQRRQRRAA